MKNVYFRLYYFIFLSLLIFAQGCNIQPSMTPKPNLTETKKPTLAPTLYKSMIPPTARPTRTITPIPYAEPKWEIDIKESNFALVVLDYQTYKFKEAYFFRFDPCSVIQPKKSDEFLLMQGNKLFEEIDGERNLQHVGDFALFEIIPFDLGGAAVLDPCSGQLLFAGRIAMGGGEQVYPIHPIEASAIEIAYGTIMAPQRIDVIASPDSTTTEGFETAWNSAKNLNIVHDFATNQYSIFIYLYGPFIRMFSPTVAEWLIFVFQGPSDI